MAVIAPREWAESDDECLGDEDWASQIASELLQSLTDAEKKRQEIINGESPLGVSLLRDCLTSYSFLFQKFI